MNGGIRIAPAQSSSRWLLCSVPSWRRRSTRGSRPPPAPIFVESSAATGLTFTHVNGATGEYYIAEEMGAGVALIDYDNDGDLDVFFVQEGTLIPRPPGRATRGQGSRLFRNDLVAGKDGPQLRFTDVTEQAHLDTVTFGMGVATADYDGDGDVDLLVTSFGPETLYRNNGDGTFTDVTATAGISDQRWSTSAALRRCRPRWPSRSLRRQLSRFHHRGQQTVLRFRRRSRLLLTSRLSAGVRALLQESRERHLRRRDGQAGISKACGAGLGVATGDYNRDGWLDLFVANDATPNQLWMNRGDGTFVDEGVLSGVAFNAAGNPEGSMGIASGDSISTVTRIIRLQSGR